MTDRLEEIRERAETHHSRSQIYLDYRWLISEVERLRIAKKQIAENMQDRDRFIVDEGLWDRFVDILK